MGDLVNLRQVRKSRQKTEAAALATANRAKHGQTRTERTAIEREQARSQRLLDGAALSRDSEPSK